MWVWYPEGQESGIQALRRATLTKVDDSGKQQIVEVRGLASEQMKGLLRVQAHGFSSNPPVNAEGVILSLGHRSDRAVVLGVEDPKTRYTGLDPGQSVLYDDQGNIVIMKGGGGIEVHAKAGAAGVTADGEKVWLKPGEGKIAYVGGNGADGKYAPILTVDGPSRFAHARIA